MTKGVASRVNFEGRDVVYKFPDTIPDQDRSIFLGAYPPKQADANLPHDNMTCRCIISALGHDRFVFIDIIPVSPVGNSSDIDYEKLMRNVDDALDCDNRLRERVAEYEPAAVPIIHVCGQAVRVIFVTRMPSITDLKVLVVELGMYSVNVGGRKCIVLMDHDHPSAHLMSGGEQSSRH